MQSIEYVELDESGLDGIASLWQKLNAMHAGQSSAFAPAYQRKTFAERKKEILAKARGKALMVHAAKETGSGAIIGYCVNIAGDGEGEVESLYVEPEFRHAGVGDVFMKRAVAWMDSLGVSRKKILVYAGNEGVMKFYQRYGFRPRYIVLEQVEESKQ